jgi:hypothetical protein
LQAAVYANKKVTVGDFWCGQEKSHSCVTRRPNNVTNSLLFSVFRDLHATRRKIMKYERLSCVNQAKKEARIFVIMRFE